MVKVHRFDQLAQRVFFRLHPPNKRSPLRSLRCGDLEGPRGKPAKLCKLRKYACAWSAAEGDFFYFLVKKMEPALEKHSLALVSSTLNTPHTPKSH